MRIQMQFAAVVATALLGACVGDVQPPSDDGDGTTDDGTNDGTDDGGTAATPRQIFDRDVKGLLTTKCAGCHVGPTTSPTNMFLGPDGESSYYASLEKDRAVTGGWVPASATLLSKGQHAGPAWQPAEADKITRWLQAEQMARGVDTTPTPTPAGNTNARNVAMQFAACLSVSQTEYQQTQAYQIANLNSGQGRCYSCHNQGAGGSLFDISNNYNRMFNKWQEEVFFYGVFLSAAQTQNTPITFKIAAAEQKICAKGTEKARNAGTHPEFNCQQNNGTALNNLKNFIQLVNTKAETPGACPTPAFKAPTP